MAVAVCEDIHFFVVFADSGAVEKHRSVAPS